MPEASTSSIRIRASRPPASSPSRSSVPTSQLPTPTQPRVRDGEDAPPGRDPAPLRGLHDPDRLDGAVDLRLPGLDRREVVRFRPVRGVSVNVWAGALAKEPMGTAPRTSARCPGRRELRDRDGAPGNHLGGQPLRRRLLTLYIARSTAARSSSSSRRVSRRSRPPRCWRDVDGQPLAGDTG